MKEKIISAVKQWNLNGKSSISTFLFPEEIKDKHRKKLENGLATGVDFKEWIAVLDETISRNGTKGCLFTNDALYLSGREKPIILAELKAVYESGHKEVIIKKKDGTYTYCKGLSKEAIEVLKIVTETEQSDVYESEKYKEMHTVYRRELRRRLSAVTKKICEQCTSLKSTETVDVEFQKRALEGHENIECNKIIGFMKTVFDNGKEAIIFTEEGLYAGKNNKKIEIPFDGLKEINSFDDLFIYTIYENGYVKKDSFYIPKEAKKYFYELVKEYLSVYQSLYDEIKDGHVVKTGLELTDGFEKYKNKKDKFLVDTYKNAVFVSSTFKDMHFERDAIHEKVQPALNVIAKQYGEQISFCDLRWGVNTENLDSEEGAKKVLTVCLDEIEKCNPCMLIMLGERYGWIPNERTIANALELRPDFELDELEKSVTALEIEFGALRKQTDAERIFVYFRELDNAPAKEYLCEDDHHAKKLAELKMRVQKLIPNRVKTYQLSWDEVNQTMNGIDRFAQMVINDIGAVMENGWKQKEISTPFEQEVGQHIRYMCQKASFCYARNDLLKECLEKMESGYHLLALTGTSGSGKSTVMSALAAVLKENDAHVLPIFCGHTVCTESAIGIIKHMVYYVENLLGTRHLNDEESEVTEEMWLSHFKYLINAYSEEKEEPLFLVIDAIDQLTADSLRDNLKFIPGNVDVLGSKVYMLISCLEEFELASFPAVIKIPILKEEDKHEVIQGILLRNRREIHESVTGSITQKESSDSPLYLTLLIQRLLMMNKNDFADIAASGDGMEAITSHQLEIIKNCGNDLSSVCKEMIDVAAERLENNFVIKAIGYIANSKHGLRESDLAGLLKAKKIMWNHLEFTLFINYLRNIFVLREDGCYDFSHKVIREELKTEERLKKEIHKDMFLWFQTLPKDDIVRNREIMNHCLEAKLSSEFIHLVVEWMEENRELSELNQLFVSCCRKDKGAWFSEVLKELDSDNLDENEINIFLEYIIKYAMREFNSSEEDLAVREIIYFELMEAAKKLNEIYGGYIHERRINLLYFRIGKVYELKEDIRAGEYYIKSLKISEELAEKYENEDTLTDLAIDYRIFAGLYMKREDEAYFVKSIEIAENADKKYHTAITGRTLAWSYKRMGDFYKKYDDKEKALEFYLKCANVRKLLVETEDKLVDIKQYSYILEILTEMYFEDDWDKAILYSEERIIYQEKVVERSRTMANMRELGFSYHDAGYSHFSKGEEENRKRALWCYEKALPVFEDILKSEDNINLLWITAEDYRNCVEILSEIGGVDNIVSMKRYAMRSIELYEYRAKTLDTYQAYNTLEAMYALYEKCINNMAETTWCLEKRIELKEKVYKMTHDRIYKKEILALKAALSIAKGLKKF